MSLHKIVGALLAAPVGCVGVGRRSRASQGKPLQVTLLFLLALASVSQAATLRVPSEYPHIQRAIVAATDGDTILLEAGRHEFFLLEIDRNITLRGEGTDKTTLIYKDRAYRYGIVIKKAGSVANPVKISDLTIEGIGEHSKNWEQYIIGTETAHVELNNIILKNPTTNFGDFTDSVVSINHLNASNIRHRLIDTRVLYSTEIAEAAVSAETVDMAEVYQKSPTRITLNDSKVSTASDLESPILLINQVALLEITDTDLQTNGPAAEVDKAFARLIWSDAPEDGTLYSNGAVKNGPTKESLQNEYPDQFRYLGGYEEDPLPPAQLTKFYDLRRKQAKSFEGRPITAAGISEILATRLSFPANKALDYFDSSWLRIELNYLSRSLDDKALALMILDEVTVPKGVSKSEYFGRMRVSETTSASIGDEMEIEIAARLSSNLDGILATLIKGIEAKSASLADGLEAIDQFTKNDLGNQLTDAQKAIVRQQAASYVDRHILSGSTETIRNAQDVLRDKAYSFAGRGELIPVQSLEARKALFETYQ